MNEFDAFFDWLNVYIAENIRVKCPIPDVEIEIDIDPDEIKSALPHDYIEFHDIFFVKTDDGIAVCPRIGWIDDKEDLMKKVLYTAAQIKHPVADEEVYELYDKLVEMLEEVKEE